MVPFYVVGDDHFKVHLGMEVAALDAVSPQLAKEPLDHVDPRGARGYRVNVDSRVAQLQRLNVVVFVRGIVVAHDVSLLVGGRFCE